MSNPLDIAAPGSAEDSPQMARFSRVTLVVALVLVFLGSLDIVLELRKIRMRETASVLNNLITINESAYLPLLGMILALLPLARHIPRLQVRGRALLTWVAICYCALHCLVVPSVIVSTIKARNLIGEKENATITAREKIFADAEADIRQTSDRERLIAIIKPLISDPKFLAEPDLEILRVNILGRLKKVRDDSNHEVSDRKAAASRDLFITAFQQGITASLLALSFYLAFFFGRPWREMART